MWFALGAAAAGLPPILFRSVASIRRLNIDINILMLIAGTFAMSCYLSDICDIKGLCNATHDN